VVEDKPTLSAGGNVGRRM